MKDTRALQMKGLADDIVALATELLDEGIDDTQEMLHVACVQRLARDIVKRAGVVYEPELCGHVNTMGSVCVQPGGHLGSHQAGHGFRWTDESNRLAAKFIAKQVGGRD